MKIRPQKSTEQTHFSYIGRRHKPDVFTAKTQMHFNPKGDNETAGMMVMMKHESHYRVELASLNDAFFDWFEYQGNDEFYQ